MDALKIASSDFEFHSVPYESVVLKRNILTVEFDDIEERRVQVQFHRMRAMRITDEDCIDYEQFDASDTLNRRLLLEVVDSSWTEAILKQTAANFHSADRQSLKHFVMMMRDYQIEVVAEGFSVSEKRTTT